MLVYSQIYHDILTRCTRLHSVPSKENYPATTQFSPTIAMPALLNSLASVSTLALADVSPESPTLSLTCRDVSSRNTIHRSISELDLICIAYLSNMLFDLTNYCWHYGSYGWEWLGHSQCCILASNSRRVQNHQHHKHNISTEEIMPARPM